MYEDFFGISRTPFSLTPDPEFLYLTPEHRDAIAGLTYGILGRKGITVLTGDAGTGKTTLVRAVRQSVPANRAQFISVINPMLRPEEFLTAILGDFGVYTENGNKAKLLASVGDYLKEQHDRNIGVVIVVDEAQRLSPGVLEEIRLLANFETDTEKLLQIILIGQDELDVLLDRHELRQLKQRIAIRLRIGSLTREQVCEYVQHRWGKVSSQPPPFGTRALSRVAAFSGGIPRLVNSICDNALLLAFAKDARTVEEDIVEEVAADLHLERTAVPSTAPVQEPTGSAVAAGSAQPTNPPDALLPSLQAYMPQKRWQFRLKAREGAA